MLRFSLQPSYHASHRCAIGVLNQGDVVLPWHARIRYGVARRRRSWLNEAACVWLCGCNTG